MQRKNYKAYFYRGGGSSVSYSVGSDSVDDVFTVFFNMIAAFWNRIWEGRQ